MNTKDLTPKQLAAIRIAVAEIDGWERWKHYDGCVWLTMPDSDRCRQTWLAGGMTKTDQQVEQVRDDCPNYPADLNAVRDVVMKMGIVPKRCIAENLEKVCEDDLPGDVWGDAFAVQNATALQRCIALLMTLAPDKWEAIKANP